MSAAWNAENYQSQYGYVWQHGESLLTLLAPGERDHILDLGCGTGQLSAQIAQCGATVMGVDSDPAMVEQARANYPQLTFERMDAESIVLDQSVDAVFSNAVLHWVSDPDAAIESVVRALKPGGRFVAEFGGKGNVKTILDALAAVTGRQDLNPWYFPGLAEYVARLDSAGLTVTFAHLFDRPTPLGEAGVAGWLTMFGQRFFC